MLRSIAIMATFAMLPTAVAADPPADWQGRYDHMMWGGGYGMVGGLVMLLFWGVVIVLIGCRHRHHAFGHVPDRVCGIAAVAR